MIRSATLLLLFTVYLSGCLGSTGPNESCENHDRQEQADYWEQNRDKEGVTQTESGLQYRVIEEGDGASPTLDSIVLIEYEGRRINGSIFDTTENVGPQETGVEGLLEGLEEGLQLMQEGATYEFVLPSYLAFGETAGGDFCPGTTVIFEVTLVEIVE
ncbi:MAG: FKBP-type peptidyl-prolyl cis-trans isomerase [Balneolaceae bacterium]|nr:FKBP-type peptidyl-prolyl cis-trans isomerase [Balneolaceae bacterium]